MSRKRTRINVRGAVQGVGFRPFVYRLARQLNLAGWVSNSAQGVLIEIEGPENVLKEFQRRLASEKPRAATIHSISGVFMDASDECGFEIRDSLAGGAKTALILPDIATCPNCLEEIFDPRNRRYFYPFTNCTHCGPRFSIIEGLPYDRQNTVMRAFEMCDACRSEYENPEDRRFHAQPIACPECGPRLELWNDIGQEVCRPSDALLESACALRMGQILALKGIGGFQLLVDARNEQAVQRLRKRKHRAEKPFAVLFPSLDAIEQQCQLTAAEEQIICSPAAPIVLLAKIEAAGTSKLHCSLARSVAPGNPNLGAMLPYSPLHHLLMAMLGFPVVATSGNLSDEPICIDEYEALERLGEIADVFLVHNRPIARHVDDSVVRVMLGREAVLRAARGYAPLAIPLSPAISNTDSELILATGPQLKNTVALGAGDHVFVSQHIGDLATEPAFAAFEKASADLPELYDAVPNVTACDLHPGYLSTQYARDRRAGESAECIGIQHHYAHVLSCMADNKIDAPVLGVSWDGTGYGTDGTIWGGEFLLIDEESYERVAHLRPFRLPGGDAAVKQPRRCAVGVLYEMFGASAFNRSDLIPMRHFSDGELRMLGRMLAGGINSVYTSSVGRLFDAVAALIGIRQQAAFEGQAAMDLEFAIQPGVEERYSFELRDAQPIVANWGQMITEILAELPHEEPGVIAAKFHNTLAELIVAIARLVGLERVALTGGCFQNKYLLERSVDRLREEGFEPCWHRRVPPNDGGISLGQILGALRVLKQEESNTKVMCVS